MKRIIDGIVSVVLIVGFLVHGSFFLPDACADQDMATQTLATYQDTAPINVLKERLEQMCGGPLNADEYRAYYEKKYGVSLREEMRSRRHREYVSRRKEQKSLRVHGAEIISYVPVLLFALKACEAGSLTVAGVALASVLGMVVVWRIVNLLLHTESVEWYGYLVRVFMPQRVLRHQMRQRIRPTRVQSVVNATPEKELQMRAQSRVFSFFGTRALVPSVNDRMCFSAA